jgi:hypothetical protein
LLLWLLWLLLNKDSVLLTCKAARGGVNVVYIHASGKHAHMVQTLPMPRLFNIADIP